MLLQHPPVFTLGAGSSLEHLRFPPGAPPIPLHRTERGGEVTYHGPGQLVMYPILDLRQAKPDLHWYLRQLEQVVIGALDAVAGLQGRREEGLTGVWVDGAKVAAIGVRARKWVTYHGLALNVLPDLRPFGLITPCGIEGRPVTSVQQLLAAREAQQAADDPFLSPAAAQPTRPMVPLAEASQDDLRRMLAEAGGPMPPVVPDSAAAPGQPQTQPPGELDPLDDPFAPPQALQAPAVSTGGDDGGGASQASMPEATPPAWDGGGGGGNGDDVSASLAESLCADAAAWGGAERLLLREYAAALLAGFEEVFEVELVRAEEVGGGGGSSLGLVLPPGA